MFHKTIFLSIIFLYLSIQSIFAQPTSIAVDINKAKLLWDWVQGPPPNDGIPTEFRVKCGTVTGIYTQVTPVAFPTKELAIIKAISESGTYFCVVTSANEFGECTPTNEISFRAGTISVPPTRLKLQSQRC